MTLAAVLNQLEISHLVRRSNEYDSFTDSAMYSFKHALLSRKFGEYSLHHA